MKRQFTPSMRRALYRISGGRCEQCGQQIAFEEMEGDHVFPWRAGGATDVINGQALCGPCNREKGGKIMTGTVGFNIESTPLNFISETSMESDSPVESVPDGIGFNSTPVSNKTFRKWQRKALRQLQFVIGETNDDADLAQACPGAGKTVLGCAVAYWGTSFATFFDRVVVVSPTIVIRDGWVQTFKEDFGIDLNVEDSLALSDPDQVMSANGIDSDGKGFALTYQALIQSQITAEFFRAYTIRKRVLVILDEIHHAEEGGDGMARALVHAFQAAAFKLCLSGTPFRTNGRAVPFLKYEDRIDPETGESYRVVATHPDLTYTYGAALRALMDGDDEPVCRVVNFVTVNGSGEVWKRRLGDDHVTFDVIDLDSSNESDWSLRPLLMATKDKFVREMLDQGIQHLNKMRETDSTAGMLIVCIDGNHAKLIEDVLIKKCREKPVLVLHDTPDAHKKIKEFRNSTDRILVSVKMVAEGVDIKRLRVGVYLTNVLTRLFFIQLVGRFVRWDKDCKEDNQYSVVIIPKHQSLVEYAREIEGQVLASLSDSDDDDNDDDDDDDGDNIIDIVPADLFESGIRNVVANEDHHIRRGEVIEEKWLSAARRVQNERPGMRYLSLTELAQILRDSSEVMGTPHQEAPPKPSPHENPQKSISEIRRDVRGQIASVVCQICRFSRIIEQYGEDERYAKINSELNRAVGIESVKNASEKALREKLRAAEHWLRDLIAIEKTTG